MINTLVLAVFPLLPFPFVFSFFRGFVFLPSRSRDCPFPSVFPSFRASVIVPSPPCLPVFALCDFLLSPFRAFAILPSRGPDANVETCRANNIHAQPTLGSFRPKRVPACQSCGTNIGPRAAARGLL